MASTVKMFIPVLGALYYQMSQQ